ncbi:MAG: hypothetical protein ACTSPL_07835 [Candidatus Odinarchaeia archaeon]
MVQYGEFYGTGFYYENTTSGGNPYYEKVYVSTLFKFDYEDLPRSYASGLNVSSGTYVSGSMVEFTQDVNGTVSYADEEYYDWPISLQLVMLYAIPGASASSTVRFAITVTPTSIANISVGETKTISGLNGSTSRIGSLIFTPEIGYIPVQYYAR